ncbi:ATPase, T2SS/T4P/T4SS family [Candidatus Accumulibacter necessarius]|uniref:ATPase, T2SS/T4P/T4SS family n=1 Tax=Candidatus Accumulibacter necessarius TaxID=2954386 RepID=UPI003DA7AE13
MPTRRSAPFRACSTSASCPTSWPATSSASSPSGWCGACACTARCPTRPKRTRRACSATWPRDRDRSSTAPAAASAASSRAIAGRLAIMELLRINGDMDELIARRSTVREMRQLASRQGFTTLADDGLRRVLDGSTSLEEVGRVVDLTDRM